MHDEWGAEDDECLEAVLQHMGERVCPIPDGRLGTADPGRYFHNDLILHSETELELEILRARFRASLERHAPNVWWLLERIGRIEDEQARRAEGAWPPAAPGEARAPATPPAARRDDGRDELERALEYLQHQEWVRWQARQAPEEARRGGLTVLRGGADGIERDGKGA